jgi:hypothetical protein
VSSDYGNTWTAKETTRNWYSTSINSSGQYQSATVTPGLIYMSDDYGNTWTPKESTRFWLSISMSSNGKYQTAVNSAGYIYITKLAMKINLGDTSVTRLISNGNVGIGTTSPGYPLDVIGSVNSTGFRITNGSLSGYTPSILDVYEEYLITLESVAGSVAGYTTNSITLQYTRIGDMVNISFPRFSFTGNNISVYTVLNIIGGNPPIRFVPLYEIRLPFFYSYGSSAPTSDQNYLGTFVINTNGTMYMSSGYNATDPFTSGQTVNIFPPSITYKA